MIHVQTGNRLDVVEQTIAGKTFVVGLQTHSGQFIPLPDPAGLLEVLKKEMETVHGR